METKILFFTVFPYNSKINMLDITFFPKSKELVPSPKNPGSSWIEGQKIFDSLKFSWTQNKMLICWKLFKLNVNYGIS